MRIYIISKDLACQRFFNAFCEFFTKFSLSAVALLRQHVEETYGLTGRDLADRVNSLLMSTATIAKDEYNRPYSPRKQGAGLADVEKAVTTKAYLYSEGMDKAKIEVGDDPEKTGEYTFSLDRYKAGLSLQLPIYAYWGKKDGEVIREDNERSRVLSPDDRLLGMFIAHVYDKEFPREAKGESAAYEEVSKKLKFQGPFDPAILGTPFVLGKGSATWIAGIKPTNKKEKAAGASDWKIASPGEADLSPDQIDALASPAGIVEEGGSYLPSVPEVAGLAEALISGWAFPIAPLCLNIDAIEDKLASGGTLDDDDDDSEEEEGESSSSETGKKGRKALVYSACKDCSFQDVCYVRRDYFRRFGPDFQKKDFRQGSGKIEVRGGDEDA